MSNRFQCSGKFRFGIFALAKKAAKRLHNKQGDALHAYACNQCGGFHVGHSLESKI